MVDVSIVIPFVNEYPALIHTMFAIQNEFIDLNYSYEIVLVENRKVNDYTEKFLHYMRALKEQGKLQYHFEPKPCGPTARQRGARHAKGKYLIFTDAHVQFGKNTVPLLLETLEEKDAGIVHGSTVWSHAHAHNAGCHYALFKRNPKTGKVNRNWPNLYSHFHGGYTRCKNATEPYQVAGGTLAYVAMFKEKFLKGRGYHPECIGYPHPEGYLPLKSWMLDEEVWLHPLAYHYHSLYPRNYGPQIDYPLDTGRVHLDNHKDESLRGTPIYHKIVGNDFLIRNAMICAFTLGGETWLDRVYNEWLEYRKANKEVLDLIRRDAIKHALSERKWILDNATYTLDKVLEDLYQRKVKGLDLLPWKEES